MDKLSARIANDLSELERLAGLIEAFGERNGLAPKTIFNLNLVLDELVTNTVNYGYDDSGPHAIDVTLECAGGLLTLVIEDDGRAFDPLRAPEPDLEASLDDRRVGGLGVHLVRTLMDTVDYDRVAGRNRLVMTKRIAA